MLNMRRTYSAPLRVSDQEPYPPSVGEGSAHKGGRVQKRGERQGLLMQHAKDADVLRERRELDTPGRGPGILEEGGSGEKEVPLLIPHQESIAEAQPQPQQELHFRDDRIRKNQLVPEAPPPGGAKFQEG